MPSRRIFIAASAVIAAAGGVFESGGLAAADAEQDPERAVVAFDLGALMARLDEPAKHKQVFASPRVAEGAVLGYMRNSLDAYETGFGEGPGTLRVAAVFYGRGVALALDDQAWTKYKIAAGLEKLGEKLSHSERTGNPYWHAPPGENSLEVLAGRGALYLACNNALKGLASALSGPDGSSEDVHADLRRHLIPGAILVPAGVAALNAAQEARFTYMQAAL